MFSIFQVSVFNTAMGLPWRNVTSFLKSSSQKFVKETRAKRLGQTLAVWHPVTDGKQSTVLKYSVLYSPTCGDTARYLNQTFVNMKAPIPVLSLFSAVSVFCHRLLRRSVLPLLHRAGSVRARGSCSIRFVVEFCIWKVPMFEEEHGRAFLWFTGCLSDRYRVQMWFSAVEVIVVSWAGDLVFRIAISSSQWFFVFLPFKHFNYITRRSITRGECCWRALWMRGGGGACCLISNSTVLTIGEHLRAIFFESLLFWLESCVVRCAPLALDFSLCELMVTRRLLVQSSIRCPCERRIGIELCIGDRISLLFVLFQRPPWDILLLLRVAFV